MFFSDCKTSVVVEMSIPSHQKLKIFGLENYSHLYSPLKLSAFTPSHTSLPLHSPPPPKKSMYEYFSKTHIGNTHQWRAEQ